MLDGWSLAIADGATDRALGQIGLWITHIRHGRADLGYWIAPSAQLAAHRRRTQGHAVLRSHPLQVVSLTPASSRRSVGSSTCATLLSVRSVGLRELRQDASELIRRVETGEEIDITVAGRLAARIVPVAPRRWQTWDAIAELFSGPTDPTWESDRELVDQSMANPWDNA